MQFEWWAIRPDTIAVIGMVGLYVWYLLAHASIFDKVFAYPREHWGPLWMCAWCSSFWITGLLLLATGSYDPYTHLAAAGVVGVLGSHV